MTTYTSQDIAQLLEGSVRINQYRAMIVQFFQMIAPFLTISKVPTGSNDKLQLYLGGNQNKLNVTRDYMNGSVVVWYHRGNPVTNSINLIGGEANHLRREEVIEIYDFLPTVLSDLVEFCPRLSSELQFFLDVAKR